MHCHLLIPGLFPTHRWADPGLRLSGLEVLLARGKAMPLSGDGPEAWLCRAFGVTGCPAAAFTLLAEGGSPGTDYWLLAEPVHLQLQRGRMVLVDAESLAISPEEAAALTAALNSHFAADGLRFFPTRPGRWHLRLSHPAGLETHPLNEVVGRDVQNFLPGGPDGRHWHRILNEIQMLLHGHPVNEARERRGALPVNSVWPWGGGIFPGKLSAPYARVWASDALACGLAEAAGLPHAQAPQTPAQWLQAASPGIHLVVLDTLRGAALYGDFPRWREALLRLENDWFSPLCRALAQGKISRLTLHVFGDSRAEAFAVSRADLWKLWRRGRPVTDFLETNIRR